MHLEPLLTDDAILKEIGHRLSQLRLNRNLTQAEVAAEAGITRPTLVRIEKGMPTDLVSFLRLIRALNLLDGLDGLIPAQSISPVERALAKRENRQRARKPSRNTATSRVWKWGDE
jgi:transcriptional regulator with XRE-family HTH domain